MVFVGGEDRREKASSNHSHEHNLAASDVLGKETPRVDCSFVEPAEGRTLVSSRDGVTNPVLPEGVRATASVVGILIPWSNKQSAYECLECDDKRRMCRFRKRHDGSLVCSFAERVSLCANVLDQPRFALAREPSLGRSSCTVSAVGREHILTAGHCLPTEFVCGKSGEISNRYLVFFDYKEASDDWFPYYEVDLSYEPFLSDRRRCNRAEKKSDDRELVEAEDVNPCGGGMTSGAAKVPDGAVVARLVTPHGRGGGGLRCGGWNMPSRSASVYSLNHPLGAPMVLSGGGDVTASKGVLRASLFHEVGSSGAPLLDENSGLIGVAYGLGGMWDYCSVRGAECNDCMECDSAVCGRVRAALVGSAFCECFGAADQSACFDMQKVEK